MGNSKSSKPHKGLSRKGVLPPRTQGPTGRYDQSDPGALACFADTPGPVGRNDGWEMSVFSTPLQACIPVCAPLNFAGKCPDEGVLTEDELIEAGLMALAQVLDTAGKSTGVYRALYQHGEEAIVNQAASMKAAGATETQIAEHVSEMRRQLALKVREASGELQKKAAELFDLVRGNKERPSYSTLRAAGKSDAQIIETAAKTNKWVNRLPGALKWTGRVLVIAQAAYSIYVTIEAPPDQRVRVAAQEAGGFFGGFAGAEVGGGLCIAFGIATEGIGLLACGLVGGVGGYSVGRHAPSFYQAILEIEIRKVEQLDACEQFTGFRKALCQSAAVGNDGL